MKEFFFILDTTPMNASLSFDFCNIKVFDFYIIVTFNEGVTVTPKMNNTLIHVTETHFDDQPFIYISNRINSYAVNPETYLDTVKIKNLKGFAIVSTNYQAKVNARIEKMFFSKPFETFSNIDDAIRWGQMLISR